ncbi:Type II secretion system protein C [Halioglobus japonicus]|nr:Type II secretion system protein C [Halioglobus japonicus]
MAAQWLSNSSAVSARVSAAATTALSALSRPDQARRLRQVLLCLLAIWAVLALSRLIWSLVPTPESAAVEVVQVINPVTSGGSVRDADPVDIDTLVAWHLFGEVGAAAVDIPLPEESRQTSARDGIEDGAKETRLQLTLRGIVSSTEDGLGFAIIESNNQQDVYSVEDKLPVSGEVILAKVMPKQVVLDNGGTYELLVLYEESMLGGNKSAPPAALPAPALPKKAEQRNDSQTTSLAKSYRERLYSNPQSLAQVVRISAVREGSAMRGYRISPGTDASQFAQLGFEAGDVVTGINGVSLDNPANTMVLYNSLRTAGEVVFELERGGEPLTLSVNLDDGATQ